MATPTTKWQRLSRRLGRGGNPLRRRTDVMEAWLVPIAIVVFLALCPLVVSLTGSWMRAADASEARAQAHWQHYPGVLLEPVPGPEQINHGANSWTTWVPATWTERGVTHRGEVPAAAGSRARSPVTVWIDTKGHVVYPPLTPGVAGSRVLEARAGGLTILAVLLAVMVMFSRRILDRWRLRSWGSAWLAVGPTWSRHR